MFVSLEETFKACQDCKQCELGESRTQIVFSDGNPQAKIVLIGEAPGSAEDKEGRPFVGASGKLLDKFFLEHGLSREKDLYICNTVKCRPPNNRNPKPEEKEACKPFLEAQLAIIKPKILLLCGAVAMQSFLPTKLGISKMRGECFEGPHKAIMMPIFHPAYLLRNHSTKEGSPRGLMNEDLQKIVKLYKED